MVILFLREALQFLLYKVAGFSLDCPDPADMVFPEFSEHLQSPGDARYRTVQMCIRDRGKDSHEYGLLYDYLDFMTSLYWKKAAPEEIDLNKAEQILDEQHYGCLLYTSRCV